MTDDVPEVDSAHAPPMLNIRKPAPGSPSTQAMPFQYPTHGLEPSMKNIQMDSPSLKRHPTSFVYKTRGARRGACVIVSVDSFKSILCLPTRPGAEVDLQHLEESFKQLDFDVKIYRNPTAGDISRIIEQGKTALDSDVFFLSL